MIKRMNGKTNVLAMLLIILVIISGISLSACRDGYFELIGEVYEWVDAPDDVESKIFIETCELQMGVDFKAAKTRTLNELKLKIGTQLPNIVKIPLDGVEIAANEKNAKSKLKGVTYWPTSSNSTGNFRDEWIVTPEKGQIIISASKPDYHDISSTMDYSYEDTYVIVVLLVRER